MYKYIYYLAIFGFKFIFNIKYMKPKVEIETNNLEAKSLLSVNDIIAILIFTAYMLVDYVPAFASYSPGEPQWLYLNILNIVVTAYIFYDKTILEGFNIGSIFKNKVVMLYTIFVIISGISIMVAYHKQEGIITFCRYLIIMLSFFNLYILFRNKQHTYLYLASIMAILMFFECVQGLNQILKGYATRNYSKLILETTIGHGNKNILSSTVLLKLPFLFYCILMYDKLKRNIAVFILFISLMLLFLLNTRALIIGSLTMTVVFMFFMNRKFKDQKIKFLNYTIALTFGIALSLSILIIKNGRTDLDSLSALDRLTSINLKDSSLKNRLNFWKSSADYMSKKPILGSGLGNWKIESLDYEHQWKIANSNAIHMHNDVLEVAAETGIFNGLVFIAFLAFIGLINLRNIYRNEDEKKRLFSVILLASFIGYSFDTMFNFPLNRPTVQIVFIIILALSIINSINKPEAVSKQFKFANTIFLSLFIILGVSTVYPNMLMVRTYQALNLVIPDQEALLLKYDDVSNMFKDFPNLDAATTPIVGINANYLIKEKRYEEAYTNLHKAIKINPKSVHPQTLLVKLYEDLNIRDSAHKYNKHLYDVFPNYLQHYEKYIQSLSYRKDTASILKSFKKVVPNNYEPKYFASTFKFLLDAGYNPEKSFKILEKGSGLFPEDTLLLRMTTDYKKMTIANPANNPKYKNPAVVNPLDFNAALKQYFDLYKINKNDYNVIENIGICYYQLKKYNEAISYLKKVVDSKVYQNGKAEYVIAASYYYLKDFKNACEYGRLASSKKYPGAEEIIKTSCK
jgi:O-antigen ligase